MRLCHSWLESACLPILLLAAASALHAAGEPNAFVNGGFEDRLAGWVAEPAASVSCVEKKDAAFRGSRCVMATANAPKQAVKLVQDIDVRADRNYTFRMTARGNPGVRFGLFRTVHGGKREPVMIWDNASPKWRTFQADVPPAPPGRVKFEVIAASSFGDVTGSIWLDEIELTSTPRANRLDLTAGEGFNDEPTLAATDDGTAYAAWVSFRDGADTLQLAHCTPDGNAWRKDAQWQIAGGPKTYVLGPTLVSDGTRVHLLYAAEHDGNWDIFHVACGPKGPAGYPAIIAPHPGVDIKPAAAWDGNALQVAWESNRDGRRRIFATTVRDGKAADEPLALSPADASAYAPTIAIMDARRRAVAWHDFRRGHCDIYLRTAGPDGQWAPERRLTRAPAIDRHARLVARGAELWIAYETAQVREYHVGTTDQRAIVVARITPEGLFSPTAGPIAKTAEDANFAFDAEGRLWVAYIQGNGPRPRGWMTWIRALTGKAWGPPVRVSDDAGRDRMPALAVAGNRILLAPQSDDIKTWSSEAESAKSRGDIALAALPAADAPPAAVTELTPFVESTDAFAPLDLREARGEDSPPRTIEYNGRTYHLYFGDLHEHTDVSPCARGRDQTIDESYQAMRDLAVHDFACTTDHGYSLNPYLWHRTAKLVRANCDPGRFLTFLAEEWTSTFEEYSVEHPYGFYGHRNLILADPYFPRWWNARTRQTPAELWSDLRKLNANFVNIPHQLADTGNVPTDWNFVDETAQPVAEIFQTRGSYEAKDAPREAKRSTPKGWFLQDAWARGIVIGVIASPDHGGGYGKACVYASDLTREAVLDALRARRCYGTSAARIFLDVRVGGHIMGEKTPDPAPPGLTVDVHAEAPADIARIDVCRNNEYIYTREVSGQSCTFTYADRSPPEGRVYYYVRVQQADGELAWSSPVWFGAR